MMELFFAKKLHHRCLTEFLINFFKKHFSVSSAEEFILQKLIFADVNCSKLDFIV